MADLDIVDEKDHVVDKAPYEVVHRDGLWHRSVQVFVFKESGLRNLLVAQRGSKQEVSGLRFHPSVGGHVKQGQSYDEAAREETREELFYQAKELPSGLTLVEVARFPNISRSTNRERSCLFYSVFEGPFDPDPKEIKTVYWQDRDVVWNDMKTKPERYTKTFVNSMRVFRIDQGECV